MKQQELVSIIVTSYNSSKTIIKTLESIKCQTYHNIELIVTDDGSRDDTCSLVSEWLNNNIERFCSSSLLTVSDNTGTPANCNRGVKAARGKWIKLIAGDDMLLPNCISDFICYVLENRHIRILYSDFYSFREDENGQQIVAECPGERVNHEFDVDPATQLNFYLSKGFNISPAIFMQKKLVEEIGFFIEKYQVFEDTPFYFKVLRSGVKIYHMPQFAVMYRVGAESVTTDSSGMYFYKTAFVDNIIRFKKEMVFPLYKWYHFCFWAKEYSYILQYRFTVKVLKNRRTKFRVFLYYIFKSLNPYYFLGGIKKRLS